MYLRRGNENYGIVGVQTDFTDSSNQRLYVGDIVAIMNKERKQVNDGNCIIVKDWQTNRYEVMGLYGRARQGFVNNAEWRIFRAIPYNKIQKGFHFESFEYCEDKKEMTISEIEKELGYPIKVVKEREDN